MSPRHGVITLAGYGIAARIDKGHLILEDGIGTERRAGRFSRVHHGIERVVVIGNDGTVSLAALRWLADQGAAFAMLERDGTVLVTTGPVAASDARLRRVQACVQHEPAGIEIVRELIREKLAGQERVSRDSLLNSKTADSIARFRGQLDDADTYELIRAIESHGAADYWTGWQGLEIQFPKSDLARVPAHWLKFDNRRSPISGTARKPSNPVNAILNYLYTILETETRLAIVALGIDPGMGLLHVDQSARDSLVYDLMEPIRPKLDAYVLDWISRTPLKKSWFFEQRDGSCRLMATLTTQLAETAVTWRREIAPIVEWFARVLSDSTSGKKKVPAPGTRLTQRRRTEGANGTMPAPKRAPRPSGLCVECGRVVSPGIRHCHECAMKESGKRLSAARELGRIASASAETAQKKSDRMKLQRDAITNWSPADLPDWLDDECFRTRVQPVIAKLPKTALAEALGLSREYVYRVASGERFPHRRHWLKLAELAGVGR